MTIQCRTGCGQQVYPALYYFSDGFVYALYMDFDDLPHHCSNIPDNYYDDWPNSWDADGNRIHVNNYEDFFNELFYMRIMRYAEIEGAFPLYCKSNYKTEIIEIDLEQTKTCCNVLPMPFYQIDPEQDETIYNLTQLSDCYFQLGKIDDALLALTIQHKITNDQMTHMTTLEKKQRVIPTSNTKLTVQSIKDKVQDIEFRIKKYLRQFPIKEIFEYNEMKRAKIEKHLRNQIILDKAKERDEIDALSLGDCESILYYFKNKLKNKFPEWTDQYRPFLMLIVGFRNHISAHPNTKNSEDDFTDNEKIFYNVACEKLIRHLENISHK